MLKLGDRAPEALPGLADIISEAWDPNHFAAWLQSHGKVDVTPEPLGRRLVGAPDLQDAGLGRHLRENAHADGAARGLSSHVPRDVLHARAFDHQRMRVDRPHQAAELLLHICRLDRAWEQLRVDLGLFEVEDDPELSGPWRPSRPPRARGRGRGQGGGPRACRRPCRPLLRPGTRVWCVDPFGSPWPR